MKFIESEHCGTPRNRNHKGLSSNELVIVPGRSRGEFGLKRFKDLDDLLIKK